MDPTDGALGERGVIDSPATVSTVGMSALKFVTAGDTLFVLRGVLSSFVVSGDVVTP